MDKKEFGGTLVEVLATVTILAFAAGTVGTSVITSLRIYKKSQVSAGAHTLGIQKIEQLSIVNRNALDDSYDESESNLVISTVDNLTFTRTVDVTVNSDNSKTVDVVVVSNNLNLPVSATYSTTFSVWN